MNLCFSAHRQRANTLSESTLKKNFIKTVKDCMTTSYSSDNEHFDQQYDMYNILYIVREFVMQGSGICYIQSAGLRIAQRKGASVKDV